MFKQETAANLFSMYLVCLGVDCGSYHRKPGNLGKIRQTCTTWMLAVYICKKAVFKKKKQHPLFMLTGKSGYFYLFIYFFSRKRQNT